MRPVHISMKKWLLSSFFISTEKNCHSSLRRNLVSTVPLDMPTVFPKYFSVGLPLRGWVRVP